MLSRKNRAYNHPWNRSGFLIQRSFSVRRKSRSLKTLLLITGRAGFIGSNLADFLSTSHGVTILDNLSRPGSQLKLEWLRSRYGSQLRVVQAEMREMGRSLIVHLAAQAAVTTSVTARMLNTERGHTLQCSSEGGRPGAPSVFVGEIGRAQADFGWQPLVGVEQSQLGLWIKESKDTFVSGPQAVPETAGGRA